MPYLKSLLDWEAAFFLGWVDFGGTGVTTVMHRPKLGETTFIKMLKETSACAISMSVGPDETDVDDIPQVALLAERANRRIHVHFGKKRYFKRPSIKKTYTYYQNVMHTTPLLVLNKVHNALIWHLCMLDINILGFSMARMFSRY